jgi:hypothetical protein
LADGPRRGRADRRPRALRPSASGGRAPISRGNAVSRVSPFRRSYSVVRCRCSRGPRGPPQGPAFPVADPETPRTVSPPPSARKRRAEDSSLSPLRQPGSRSTLAVDPWLCVPQPPAVGGANSPLRIHILARRPAGTVSRTLPFRRRIPDVQVLGLRLGRISLRPLPLPPSPGLRLLAGYRPAKDCRYLGMKRAWHNPAGWSSARTLPQPMDYVKQGNLSLSTSTPPSGFCYMM